ncbi:MAG TPA: GNAT family N-acetyltransferase [Xanthobacteraceae bacterium]|jgi:phosphinothricin acetyltransferase|nr:GNAT family N-acetyltransferase [Xanthobacteraceae bacterium]
MLIRDAAEDDLPGILAIYNHVIAHTTAVYTETPAPLEDRRAWLNARRDARLPVLVADDGGVIGFASFGDFRPWPGYARSVEHSVHVREDARGRGVGSALMRRLIEEAQARDKHVMIGGIDAANTASIALHRKLGFFDAGVLREVAQKFGRSLDLLFMQKML